jgi:hypothetical protein
VAEAPFAPVEAAVVLLLAMLLAVLLPRVSAVDRSTEAAGSAVLGVDRVT